MKKFRSIKIPGNFKVQLWSISIKFSFTYFLLHLSTPTTAYTGLTHIFVSMRCTPPLPSPFAVMKTSIWYCNINASIGVMNSN